MSSSTPPLFTDSLINPPSLQPSFEPIQIDPIASTPQVLVTFVLNAQKLSLICLLLVVLHETNAPPFPTLLPLLLREIQSIEHQDLEILLKRVQAKQPEAIEEWKQVLHTLTNPDALFDIFSALNAYLEDNGTLSEQNSPLGIFCRKCKLEFQAMSWERMGVLLDEFREYCRKAGIILEESDETWPLFKNPAVEVISKVDMETFLDKQVSLLATAGALPPVDLKERLGHVIDTMPDLSKVHFVNYQNCLRMREYQGALYSLRKFFDLAMSNRSLHPYALLHLAALHHHFGHVQEAKSAIGECIEVARLSQDPLCLNFATAWLVRLESNSEGPSSLTHVDGPYLQVLTELDKAKKFLLEGESPYKVFEPLIKACAMIRHDVLNGQTDEDDKKVDNQVLLAAMQWADEISAKAWDTYGLSVLDSATTSMLPATDSMMVRRAVVLARKGQWNEAKELLNQVEPTPDTEKVVESLLFDRAMQQEALSTASVHLSHLSSLDKDEFVLKQATFYVATGCHAKAAKLLSEALTKVTTAPKATRLLEKLVQVYNDAKALSHALPYLLLLHLLSTTHHLSVNKWQCSLYIAQVMIYYGIPDRAMDLIESVLSDILAYEDVQLEGYAWYVQGLSLVALNSLDLALSSFEKSLEAYGKLQYLSGQVMVLHAKCLTLDKMGQVEKRNETAMEFQKLKNVSIVRRRRGPDFEM